MLEPLGDAYGKADFLNQLGSVYELQGKTDNAIRTFEESLQISKKYDLKEQISDGLLHLSILYEVKKDYKKSLNSIKEHFLVRDSISNAATVRKLSDLRTKFEVGQKQTEVDLLTAEKKTQQIISWAIAAFALTIIILAGIIYKYYKSKATINLTLQSQKYELERLNETKDKFFSIISHDLRGPISAFQGVGRMIKFAVKKDKKDYLLELSDDIDESAGRLSNLLDGLLSWALQQQGHFPNVPEKVFLKSIVDDLTGTFKNTADSTGIALSTTFDKPIELWVDRNTTETILRNLISNALKFTEDGGSVSLQASIDGTNAKIEVIDSGVGIAQEKLDRLFNLNENKSTYGTSGEKGLGLGLQLVYEFIEMNKGSIEVQSKEGEGTRFVIRLPLFDQVSEKEPKKFTSISRYEVE
jgi:signal transduction histidine kinase